MEGQVSNEQKFIRSLIETVLANLNNNEFGVTELAHEMGVSRTSLNRKLNKIFNININQFIREVRLQRALELLQNDDLTAAEVAYKVGYKSPAYFNTCFHEYFGFSPGKAKSDNMELSVTDTVTHFTSKLNQNRIKNRTPFYHKVTFYVFSGIILVFSFFVSQKFFKTKTLNNLLSSDERISVAIMPFQNNTNDSLLDVWQDGIKDNIINSLSSSEDLIVKQSPFIANYLKGKGVTNYEHITPSIVRMILKKLDASVLIFGGISEEGSILRLNAQLTDSKTGEVVKPFQIDGNPDKIFNTSNALSEMIRNYLIISKLGKREPPAILVSWHPVTNSPEAYQFYLLGAKAYANGDYRTAENWFLKSLEIDSAFFTPAYVLAGLYWQLDMFDQSKYWCKKVYNRRAQLNIMDQLRINFMYSKCFGTDFEAIKYLKQITEMNKYDVIHLYGLGLNYSYVFQYNNAIPIFEKSLEIYDEWDSKPHSVMDYITLGIAYHKTGDFNKEKRLYKKAEQDFPDNMDLIKRQAILSLTTGDTISANKGIEIITTRLNENSVSGGDLAWILAGIYSEAGILDRAEKYYRKALSLEPGKADRMDNLAYFLIDKDRNIIEGIKLIDNALEIKPDSYIYLHTKGWGLYKQGKYEEAEKILQKSWDIRLDKAVYYHEAWLHLEQAKKASAKLK